jgi:hypothetical protein
MKRNISVAHFNLIWMVIIIAFTKNIIADELHFLKEIKFEDLYLPTMMVKTNKGEFVLTDRATKNIKIYNENGKLVRVIGRSGSGPGEFIIPRCLASFNDFLLVGDQNGRWTRLRNNGDYLSAFFAGDILVLFSDVEFVKDNKYLIGGYKQTANWSGNTLHFIDEKGEIKKSFFPLSNISKTFETIIYAGSRFCFDYDKNIYAIQPLEYKITKFNSLGEYERSANLESENYRPIKIPEPQKGGEEALPNWLQTWDVVLDINLVDTETLAVTLRRGQYELTYSTEFIDINTFKPKFKINYNNERLLFSDSENRILYFQVYENRDDGACVIKVYKYINSGE